MITFLRDKIREKSATSSTAFLLRTMVKIGPLSNVWSYVIRNLQWQTYTGSNIHYAPPEYLPTKRDCENLLLYSRSQLEKLLKFVDKSFLINARMLEIGCGNSLGLCYMLVKHGAKEVVALDKEERVNKYMDRYLRNKIEIDFSKVRFIKASVEDMPVTSESIDFCTSFAVLEHVRYPYRALKEIYRVLANGAITLHFIDLKDHRCLVSPLAFLTKNQFIYNLAQPQIYTNRLRSIHWRILFEKMGFKVRQLAITKTLDNRYIDQIANKLSKPFKGLSREELRIAEVAILAQKHNLFHHNFSPPNNIHIQNLEGWGIHRF